MTSSLVYFDEGPGLRKARFEKNTSVLGILEILKEPGLRQKGQRSHLFACEKQAFENLRISMHRECLSWLSACSGLRRIYWSLFLGVCHKLFDDISSFFDHMDKIQLSRSNNFPPPPTHDRFYQKANLFRVLHIISLFQAVKSK